MREIFFQSARENAKVPVKIFKKVCVKNFFTREKNEKKAKKSFHAHFWEKKNTARNNKYYCVINRYFSQVQHLMN